jgi:hypothetical protein
LTTQLGNIDFQTLAEQNLHHVVVNHVPEPENETKWFVLLFVD